MKKVLLFCLGLFISVSVDAQNAFIEIPQSYWDSFRIKEALQKATNGDPEAQFMVALYYTDVAINNAKFKYWIEKAAENNHPSAQCLIAQCYAVGDYGFEQNGVKALEYARKSATSNNIQAMCMMFDAYRTGMFGLSKDDQLAAYWVGKGARLGDAYCQYMYGMMLMFGIGCQQNERDGLSWLHKSADQKYIEAQCYLIGYYNSLSDKKSKDKLLSLGLDFLTNPNISQNTETILITKSIVGFELFNRKEYAKGIALVRESIQKTNNELVQFYWQMMNEYAREVLETTLDALENQ